MPKDKLPDILSPTDLLRGVRDPGRNLRDKFKGNPIALAQRFHIKLPLKPAQIMLQKGLWDVERDGEILPGLRDLIYDVCTGQVESAAVIGPRGGGKSMGVAFIEFFLVFVEKFDALNLGGSELQADQVYQYLLSYINSDSFWLSLVKGDPLQSKTETVENAWIRVLTASQKSVRSPHAGGRKPDGRMAGGILVIDEEAEAEEDIVKAALPTINTAQPSISLRSSTFHNIVGSFVELIDNHVEMGYKLYKWDIFDVCEKCDCKDKCESEEPCFREDHVENYIDPDDGQTKQRLLHKAYCGGRARFADGWIPMTEIIKLWRRMRRNHGTWEVEAMGSRPKAAGHVMKDLQKYVENITTMTGDELYMPGSPISICVDWGAVQAGYSVWQEQRRPEGVRHVPLRAEQLDDTTQTQLFGIILGDVAKYGHDVVEIAADIGGGGMYLNPKLREEYNLPVRDVNFAEEKESGAAAWNIFNDAGQCMYPAEHEDMHEQIKQWTRSDAGKINKGNDHICDTGICYFAKYVDLLGISRVRATPQSFRTLPRSRGIAATFSSQRGKRNNLPVTRGASGMKIRTGPRDRRTRPR